MVYVGVSAGSMATSVTFIETYLGPCGGSSEVLSSEEMLFGDVRRTVMTAKGAGWVDFAIIPHLDHPDHPDACEPYVAQWAAKLPVPVYAIDDQTAIKVIDQQIEVISEGTWKLYH
jgi:dipeptidase E